MRTSQPLLQDRDRLRARLKEVPAEPGCYLMRDGEALNLASTGWNYGG